MAKGVINGLIHTYIIKYLEFVVFLNISQEYFEFVFKIPRKTVFGLMLVFSSMMLRKICAAKVKSEFRDYQTKICILASLPEISLSACCVALVV